MAESKEVTHYKIIQRLLTNNWMVVFKNTDGDAFVVNAEFPVMVSYNYVFNDEKTPNLLTITFRALQNVPTINYRGSVTFSSTLRDKPCEYSISRIQSLKMIDMNKASIDVEGDGFQITEKGEGQLKTIEFNPTSLSFTDSYDGREFSQQLSFQIPFDSYRFYFHYNLLEYLDNRYYALIKTTNNNNIISGFRQGLFPSYTVSTSDSGNLITINLNAKYTTYSVLGSDTMNITTNDGFSYVPVLGECVNNIYTWTLIEQINSNGVSTNGYYCLNGFEDVYDNYTILGTYNQFDTTFGFKLTDFNIDCSEGCKINNLPSSIQFQTSGETQCFTLDATCSVVWEWNAEAITVNWDEANKRLCVTSIVDEGTLSIKGTLSDGTIRYSTVVIGSGGITGDTTTTINITAKEQTVSVTPTKGLNNVKSVTSTLQYVINQNNNGYNVSVPENPNEEPRTFTITIIYNDNSIETINIIQNRIYYKIVSSEETECFGDDYYYINKKYKGYTQTDINIFVENIKGNLIDTMSPICMSFDESRTIQKVCVDNNLYLQTDYIRDGVVIKTQLELSVEGDCEGADITSTETEYRINTGITICENNIPYYVEEKWAKVDEQWIKVYPPITITSDVEAPNSNICDVIDPNNPDGTVLYRWIDTNETYCLSGETEDGGDTTTGCTTSTTNTNYELLAIGVVDEDGNALGGFAADGDNIINTNLAVAWNKSVVIDECSYTYETKTVNANCSISTTQNTGTTFTTSISTTENTSTEYQETVTITIKTGTTTIGYVTFYRNQKPSDTGTTPSSDELAFAWTGSSSTQTYRINNTQYTATTNPYSTTLTDLGISEFTSAYGMFSGGTTITAITSIPDTSNVTIMWSMFSNCSGLTSLNVSNFDTSKVTNMGRMFSSCDGLTSLDVSSFDTSNVTDMQGMFSSCDGLTSLDVSSFNTSAVTKMDYTFFGCTSLQTLDVSNWNTSNVTNMRWMFTNCSGLTSLDLSEWNTSKVTDMEFMFENCSGLTSLDLSGWNTSKVTDMSNMFENCRSLIELDLSTFDTSNVWDIRYMFNDCTSLQTLDVSSWDVNHLTTNYEYENILSDCTSLRTLKVKSGTYAWWNSRLTEARIQNNVTITEI